MKKGEILVVDLFAGPGGLGEGISSCIHKNGNKPFEIAVSVEKEPSAHKTLTTRAFFRKICSRPAARDYYYRYVRGDISRDELFSLFPKQAKEAHEETLLEPRALGEDNKLIHSCIRKVVEAHRGPKVVIGGPPCQAYSLAGRSRNAGNAGYKANEDHRHFLYEEYLSVIDIVKPEVFVMENVRGILSAKLDGELMFPKILRDLKNPGTVTKKGGTPKYKIFSLVKNADDPKNPHYSNSTDFLIRSEKYGIPQARHRVILLGVREDIDAVPEILNLAQQSFVTVRQAIGDLPPLRSGFSKQKDSGAEWQKAVAKNANKLKRILRKNYPDVVDALELNPLENLPRKSSVSANIKLADMPESLRNWLVDTDLGCVLNHGTRGHMVEDLLRYAFCSSYAILNNGVSPKSKDFPAQLAPDHLNWSTGAHADRFRVQSENKVATTITSHISKDGHYFVHYDPRQCRSLSVREAARLQTFPDNYLFEGNRTQQYVQVGNAVPPYLARQIGVIVMNLLDQIIK